MASSGRFRRLVVARVSWPLMTSSHMVRADKERVMNPMSLTFDCDGNIVVAAPSAGAEVVVAKFTATGELLWQRSVSAAAPADDERDSVSPLLLDGPASIRASRHVGRRRGRLVAASVVAACALTIGIAGLGVQRGADQTVSAHSLQAPVTELVARAAAAPPATETEAAQPTVEETPAEAEEEAVERVEAVQEAQAPVAPEAPAASTAAAPAPKAEPDAVDPRAAVLALLQNGEAEEAAARARALVASAPSDAFSYLLLGAALQDLGRGGEARAVYYACAQHAYSGSVGECMALAGLEPVPSE